MAALTKRPVTLSRSIATRQEICRIERALYRFEIYCNIFRESPKAQYSSVYGEQKRLFFSNFAPWENEQLGCIHDFLARVVSPGQLPSTVGYFQDLELMRKKHQLSAISQNMTLFLFGVYSMWSTVTTRLRTRLLSNICCHSGWRGCIRSPGQKHMKNGTSFCIFRPLPIRHGFFPSRMAARRKRTER